MNMVIMQMKNTPFKICLLSVLVLCFALSGCQQEKEKPLSGVNLSSPEDSQSRVAELLDTMKMYRFDAVQEAPPFELMSVTGETVSLSRFRGNVVLLSFWASW